MKLIKLIQNIIRPGKKTVEKKTKKYASQVIKKYSKTLRKLSYE